jgi:hypothetical protein
MQSKKYHLVKQGMQELKAEKRNSSNLTEVDKAHTVVAESSNIPNSCLLPLANSFTFNFSFSILPDIIFDNTPIFFL